MIYCVWRLNSIWFVLVLMMQCLLAQEPERTGLAGEWSGRLKWALAKPFPWYLHITSVSQHFLLGFRSEFLSPGAPRVSVFQPEDSSAQPQCTPGEAPQPTMPSPSTSWVRYRCLLSWAPTGCILESSRGLFRLQKPKGPVWVLGCSSCLSSSNLFCLLWSHIVELKLRYYPEPWYYQACWPVS